jgi:ketosteroid isomerase-like protein
VSADLYRQAADAWNDRDVERFIGLCHPDVEFRSVLTEVEGRIYKGPDGLRQYFADLQDAIADARIEVDEVDERGDWVVARGTLRATGTASGVPLEWEIGQAARVRDGLFELVVSERTLEDALAAAGLE